MTDLKDSSGFDHSYTTSSHQFSLASREPFQWQLPHDQTRPCDHQPLSHPTQIEDSDMDQELHQERDALRNTMGESTHTLFQEQYEGRHLLFAGVDDYDPPSHLSRSYLNSLESAPTTERSFLEWYPTGNATLTFPGRDGELQTIGGIPPWVIESRCPLLGMAFEESRSGPHLHLEALSPPAALPLLRYLYTGSYAMVSAAGDYFRDVPTSVLLHCELYRLADIYELPELRSEAYLNVFRQCEFGCSSPDKPIDLCAAIRFIYEHLQEHEQIIDAIVNYCVSCFQRHHLGDDENFKELAYTIRPFHQALCRNSMGREFADENNRGTDYLPAAAAIIRLPFRAYRPEKYASREDPDLLHDDVPYHIHGNDDDDAPSRKRPYESTPDASRKSALTLALRQRATTSEPGLEQRAAPGTEAGHRSQSVHELAAGGSDQNSYQSLDEDYDMVARPEAVEAMSTDDEMYTDVEAPTHSSISTLRNEAQVLPIRSRFTAASQRTSALAESDSDSDWTVL
ncbi:hypothetical protein LTR91_009248 [Friedmanniomyces endolithicus]|uniref:BTB domain-containing protein n=1 Tax=Friedmanniomyces endolithicus TaxID=329885 RepID=A0AAN6KM09_9PEZI|nr:hypothetical protein LTR94_007593 [Friedmanniomyces endolithicus]KAK0785353.1 hypothetical protein LTR59_011077 [Friedmanniomyces endolithicus]KAK0797013.1 hypothetical protein LTR75_010022 [Friedmanniomyces endolithicus]KAK0812367.1 hypothetical protein LTR38_003389 [Friedmanniomyces endolithicus]KAK0833309.1 hypothetical protein LTR03_014888 [Friedmanniomyces endolithicus]